ncbi:MAG: pyridoxamine 5'-phosphate oxidase family protein [Alphaproteobacteria bacterium]|nr:pyridoxamine 5'-phosphate oxidase family protein [Alphaproteobacteria bacterium]
MDNSTEQSVIDIIKSCEDVQFCTFGLGEYPETRSFVNIFNHEIDTLDDLYFFASKRWHTIEQILNNPHVCLYYFNPKTRMSIRLFGIVKLIEDQSIKQKLWRDEIKKFDYTGYEDPTFCLIHFAPKTYKYYIKYDEHKGDIQIAI